MLMDASDTLLLSADFGTQGVRVAVMNQFGALVKMAFAEYPTSYPQPGWAEQDPQNWWQAFKQALAICLGSVEDVNQLRGLTICSTSSTVLAVDDTGKPLIQAILWMDNRAVKEAERINQSGHSRLQYSGGSDSVEWMIPKVLWLKENCSDLYNRSSLIVEEQDWLNFRLTGRWVASRCTATCKWNYADVEGGWSPDFMSEIGLEDYAEKLPIDVIPVGQHIGKIRSETAKELGIPEDIMVFQGGIDAHIGLLGMGAVEPGQMGIIMGTSFVHLAQLPDAIYRPGLWGPYPNALVEGLWLLEGGQVSCGSLTRWFKDHFAADLKYTHPEEEPYQVLADEAAKIPPGSEGIVVLDTWQGNRTPYRDPLVKGSFWGLTLSHTRAHLYRALLESVSYGTRNILESFSATNFKIQQLIASGGALKNRLWLQIIADVTSLPIRLPSFSEAGILGCAICSASGLGLYSNLLEASKAMVCYGEEIYPDPANYELYSFYFNQYKKTYELLAPQMHQMYRFQQRGGSDG
ncbi:FGGY-family carbohydrate kinase [Desulfosporosinus sp. Sb-LF]|uniref:FGGY-family carbohydrate kinase n=1 Tax=Desulfosporosinus sp. Sb-LF TaxID=2560027 RepID=UPI00107EEBAC|nr:FGGY-family carbohydrate kinase [Desulfosporosinus sp. Sb-LF]TGE31693.1 carbohydrate kinase [Desulfosporosinus sp. Sb-LF]